MSMTILYLPPYLTILHLLSCGEFRLLYHIQTEPHIERHHLIITESKESIAQMNEELTIFHQMDNFTKA